MKMKTRAVILATFFGALWVCGIVFTTTALTFNQFQDIWLELETNTDSDSPSEIEKTEETRISPQNEFLLRVAFADLAVSLSLLGGSSLAGFLYAVFHTRKFTLTWLHAVGGGAIPAGLANVTGVALATVLAYWIFFSRSDFIEILSSVFLPVDSFLPSMYGFLSLASSVTMLRTGFSLFTHGLIPGSIVGLLSFFLFFPLRRET